MDKNSLKILKILIKNSELIDMKNDKEIYELLFKDKYEYGFYQDILSNLHEKNLIICFGADCMLNNIQIDNIEVAEFFIERRKYYWEKIISPILTSLFMPVIVSIITTLIATFIMTHK
jgi:hypothetical protein